MKPENPDAHAANVTGMGMRVTEKEGYVLVRVTLKLLPSLQRRQ